MTDFTLADLARIVADRARAADTEASYTAKLIAAGVEKCARKFGEEAMETTLAAVGEDDGALTREAADVLYHLVVLLQARGISVNAVMAELKSRTAQSGLAEKAARGTKS